MDNMMDFDTIRVSLFTPETGLYKIAWSDSRSGSNSFICYCYGFENSTRVANGIALDRAEYTITHTGKPLTDESEYP